MIKTEFVKNAVQARCIVGSVSIMLRPHENGTLPRYRPIKLNRSDVLRTANALPDHAEFNAVMVDDVLQIDVLQGDC